MDGFRQKVCNIKDINIEYSILKIPCSYEGKNKLKSHVGEKQANKIQLDFLQGFSLKTKAGSLQMNPLFDC